MTPASPKLRALVLGSGAGGGVPQWNCGCRVCRLAWSGDSRVKPRTQVGVGISVDGANWVLLNASIDLRQQILATPALHPKGAGRHSPIGAVVLTNAEVDSSAGLLALRERQPLVLFGTEATLDAIGANRMFDVVDRDLAPRRVVRLGEPFEPAPGIKLELFAIPGKVPLWLEEGNVTTDDIGEGTVCVAVEAAGKRLVYAPGCAHVTEDLNARIANADVLFFDGTLFADDEMIANGLGDKTGRRMGHMPRVWTRRNTRVACAPHACAPHPHPHQQFESDPHRGIAGRGESEGGWLGDRVRRNGDFLMNVHTPSEPMSPDALEAALRAIGPVRYHDLHPFHGLLHDGKLNKGQVQAWALNRFVYQSAIPRKDASLIARCEDRELRREWVHRITDHDGSGDDTGGIERWLILTEGLGLDRDYVISQEGALPATKFAVEAYVRFVRERPLVEAVASSLTELFAPSLHKRRIAGMLANYSFIDEKVVAYFRRRLDQAPRDAQFALDYVKRNARTVEEQRGALAALTFKTNVLWAQLDALHHAYVDGAIPPGAFRPD